MLSKKMTELVEGSSLIREMFEEGNRLAAIYGIDNVYDYSLGNPNVEPPEAVRQAVIEIMNDESPNMVHGYMNNSGYLDVREKIASYTNAKYNTEVGSEHIVMTCGAAGGLNIVLKTLLNPDDEVIVFAPYFGEYLNYIQNYGGKMVVVPADTATFQPNLEQLKEVITDKTKALIINSPNNPTGVIYSDASLKELSEILEEKQKEYGTEIFLISDEPYRELVYDDVEVPYLLHYYQNTIVGYSYSKSLSLPGERIGYLVVNPKIQDVNVVMGALNVANRILGFVNAPSLFQRVVAKTLGTEVDVNIYKKNRDTLYDHIRKVGFEAQKPQGAFYLFMKTPIEDDLKFCQDAKQFNLLLVPGKAFGCPGYVRLSYCISYKRIVNSLPAFEKLYALYQK